MPATLKEVQEVDYMLTGLAKAHDKGIVYKTLNQTTPYLENVALKSLYVSNDSTRTMYVFVTTTEFGVLTFILKANESLDDEVFTTAIKVEIATSGTAYRAILRK